MINKKVANVQEALKGVKKVKHNNRHQNIKPKTIEKLKFITLKLG